MSHIFAALDDLLDLPYGAFEKKLTKFEEEWKNLSLEDISDEELESFFDKIRSNYANATGDRARSHLAVLGYISHFDTLIEKYFPDYVAIFQENVDREEHADIAQANYIYLAHLDEILREYTHRLSEPDKYPSYTNYIQDLIQSSMIELFFWLQDREMEREKQVKEEDKNTDILIKTSADTLDPELKMIRQYIELLGEGVLDKILYDLHYEIKTSKKDPDLILMGRFEKKQ